MNHTFIPHCIISLAHTIHFCHWQIPLEAIECRKTGRRKIGLCSKSYLGTSLDVIPQILTLSSQQQSLNKGPLSGALTLDTVPERTRYRTARHRTRGLTRPTPRGPGPTAVMHRPRRHCQKSCRNRKRLLHNEGRQ